MHTSAWRNESSLLTTTPLRFLHTEGDGRGELPGGMGSPKRTGAEKNVLPVPARTPMPNRQDVEKMFDPQARSASEPFTFFQLKGETDEAWMQRLDAHAHLTAQQRKQAREQQLLADAQEKFSHDPRSGQERVNTSLIDDLPHSFGAQENAPLPDPSLIRDEYGKTTSHPLTALDTLSFADTSLEKRKEEVKQSINKKFAYYSETNELDTSSPLVQRLQGYTDAMLEGTNHHARVVLMKRGTSPEALAFPDGTIMLSQSLLNRLDSYDEVGGVLAHEVGHIINKTFEYRSTTDMLTRKGVEWIHELATDVDSPRLLEKANLRSDGLSRSFDKLQHLSRGTAHQGMLQRSAEVAASHYLVHYETSNNTPIPLEASVKQSVSPTNYEIAQKILKQSTHYDQNVLVDTLLKLHQQDFIDLYKETYAPRTFEVFSKAMNERLLQRGVPKPDRDSYLLSRTQERRMSITPVIESGEQVVSMTEALKPFVEEERESELHKQIMGESKVNKDIYKPLIDFLLNDAKFQEDDLSHRGVYISEADLLQSLSNLRKIKFEEEGGRDVWQEKSNPLDTRVTAILSRYIVETYVDPSIDAHEPIKKDAMKAFLQRAVDSSLSITPQMAQNLDRNIANDRKFKINPKKYQESLHDVLREFVPPEPEKESVKEQVRQRTQVFFGAFLDGSKFLRGNHLAHYLTDMQEILKDIPDEERQAYIGPILEKISQTQIPHEVQIADVLDDRRVGVTYVGYGYENKQHTDEVKKENHELSSFNFKIIAAMHLFKKDCDAFYNTINQITQESSILEKDLTQMQTYNLLSPLLHSGNDHAEFIAGDDSLHMHQGLDITRFDKLFENPLLEKYMQQTGTMRTDSLQSVQDDVRELRARAMGTPDNAMYSDSLSSLLLYKDARQAFTTVMNKPVSPHELPILYSFISENFPNEPATARVMKEIHKTILASPLPITEKITYLQKNINSVGYEGLSQVADQIHTLADYQVFRDALSPKIDEYLRADQKITGVAALEVGTSLYTRDYETVTGSAMESSEAKTQHTTNLAKQWLDTFFGEKGKSMGSYTEYDPQSGKVILQTDEARSVFRSFTDVIQNLKGLGKASRMGIAMRALVDENGALTSPEKRQILGETLTKTLQVDGFVAKSLQEACSVANASVVSFPIASMMGPLLFRGLDENYVDMEKAVKPQYEWKQPLTEYIPQKQIEKIMASPTREIVAYGGNYKDYPDSIPYTESQKTLREYYAAKDRLREIFPEKDATSQMEKGLDKQHEGVDAVIQGIQASGALGVRALQLTTQLMELSPQMREKLSQSFDANPGLNKLLFWENLYKRTELAKTHPEYLPQSEFITNKLQTLDSYLGGGSLYTTFSATAKNEQGVIEPTVVKMLNPNAAYMVGEYYKLATNTFSRVKENGTEQDAFYAAHAELLLSLSNEWCLRDINDPTFERDDDLFQQTIAKFNKKQGKELFVAPERRLTSYHLKAEQQAEGRTLNNLLHDQTIPSAEKEAIVEQIATFFRYQLYEGKVTLPDGTKPYLLHSDPHPGNFIVSGEAGQHRVDVIDRNMYLQLTNLEAHAMQGLYEGNDRKFFTNFIRAISAENKMRNPLKIMELMRSVGTVTQQAREQDESQNPMVALQTIMTEMEKRQLTVPLELRLMTRNVVAMKELQKRVREKQA